MRATERGSVPGAAAVAVALSALLTWPAVLHLGDRLVGHPGNDGWNHAWGYWWVAREVLAGRWPAHTDLLNFPHGGALYFIDTAQALLLLPVTALLGPAVAYNLAILLGLAASGFGAWLLARRVTGDGPTALVALVLFEATPQLLGQAYDGVSETVCAGWIPLALWALLRLLDRPTAARALALGVLGGLSAATSWYHGLFTALASTVVLAHAAARTPWRLRGALVPLSLAGLVAAAVVGPLFLGFVRSLAAPDALVGRDPDFVWNSLVRHNVSDLVAFFALSTRPMPDLHELFGEELVIVVHLGWVALLLAAAAPVATRRYAEIAPWAWTALVAFVLALGPYLHVAGRTVEFAGHRVPLPFLALFRLLPVFDRISHPFRFVVLVALSLAMLSAVALRHLLRRRPAAARAAAAAALGALAVAETAWASPAALPVPTADARIPAAYADIAADPVPGAVLDLPLTLPNLERAVYAWYQTVHGRPVPWSLNEPMPDEFLVDPLVATLIRIEASRARRLAPRVPELDLVVAGRALARRGYRFVVLHGRFYPAFKRRQVEAVLRGALGEPRVYPEDDLAVWVLDAPGEG